MKNERIAPEDFRDDRMYVMRITSNFTKDNDGTVIASLDPQVAVDKTGKVLLITYRNTHQLPATRVDEFASYEEVINYIQKVEPTCPRLSLNGVAPNPTPSWDEHLRWLHAMNLHSATEENFVISEWSNSSNNPREIFQLKTN